MTIEVDVYSGELEGLVVAEVEFESEAQGDGFQPPDWVGRELTGDRAFENERLAEDGMPESLR
jgi:CYTH domain-containing protein